MGVQIRESPSAIQLDDLKDDAGSVRLGCSRSPSHRLWSGRGPRGIRWFVPGLGDQNHPLHVYGQLARCPLAKLEEIHESINRDLERHRGLGIVITTVGANILEGYVEIEVKDLNDNSRKALYDLYGEQYVRVIPARDMPMALPGKQQQS